MSCRIEPWVSRAAVSVIASGLCGSVLSNVREDCFQAFRTEGGRRWGLVRGCLPPGQQRPPVHRKLASRLPGTVLPTKSSLLPSLPSCLIAFSSDLKMCYRKSSEYKKGQRIFKLPINPQLLVFILMDNPVFSCKISCTLYKILTT